MHWRTPELVADATADVASFNSMIGLWRFDLRDVHISALDGEVHCPALSLYVEEMTDALDDPTAGARCAKGPGDG